MTARFHTLGRRFPVSCYSFQHLALSSFLNFANLMGVKWYVIVVLISKSLIPSGFEHTSHLLAFGFLTQQFFFFINFAHIFLVVMLFLFFFLLVLGKLLLYSKYKSLVGFWLSKCIFLQSFLCLNFSHGLPPWTECLGYSNHFQTANRIIS